MWPARCVAIKVAHTHQLVWPARCGNQSGPHASAGVASEVWQSKWPTRISWCGQRGVAIKVAHTHQLVWPARCVAIKVAHTHQLVWPARCVAIKVTHTHQLVWPARCGNQSGPHASAGGVDRDGPVHPLVCNPCASHPHWMAYTCTALLHAADAHFGFEIYLRPAALRICMHSTAACS